MPNQVTIEGNWPSPIVITRGWSRARARRWNDDTTDAFLRLERGGFDFLTTTTERLAELADAAVYSPALYPGSTRIWLKSGYEEAARLTIMERSLAAPFDPPVRPLSEQETPDWERVVAIDRTAFEGFWRMSQDGLKEALDSTRNSTVITIGEDTVVGYAIVGFQWNVSYLQRVAVHADHKGLGLGSDLVAGALAWGRSTGANLMVLNVRQDNHDARRVYRKLGFADASTSLRVLRYGP